MPQVLIVGSGTLLDEGVIVLLEAETDFQVSNVIYHAEDELIQVVAQLRPEVIVISETNGLPGTEIVNALNRRRILPGCRIIVVQPDSNTMQVFDLVTASHSEDLLRLVRNGITDRTPSTTVPPQ